MTKARRKPIQPRQFDRPYGGPTQNEVFYNVGYAPRRAVQAGLVRPSKGERMVRSRIGKLESWNVGDPKPNLSHARTIWELRDRDGNFLGFINQEHTGQAPYLSHLHSHTSANHHKGACGPSCREGNMTHQHYRRRSR